jgi:hypothetical protein
MPKTQIWPSRPLNTLLLVITNYIINIKYSWIQRTNKKYQIITNMN